MRHERRLRAGDPAEAQPRRAVGLGERRHAENAIREARAGAARRPIAVGRLPEGLVEQQICLRRARAYRLENGGDHLQRRDDTGRVVRRGNEDQPGARIELRCQPRRIEPVAAFEVETHGALLSAQGLNDVESGRKAGRDGRHCVAVIAQTEHRQMQRTDGAVGDEHVVGLDAGARGDGGAQGRVPGDRAVTDARLPERGHQPVVEDLAERQVLGGASAQVVADVGLRQRVRGGVENASHASSPRGQPGPLPGAD